MRRNKRQSVEGQAQASSRVTPRNSEPDGAPEFRPSSNLCLPSDDAAPGSCDVAISAVAEAFKQQESACQEYDRIAGLGSRFAADEGDDVLHQLSSVLTSVILNAQMLVDFALPTAV